MKKWTQKNLQEEGYKVLNMMVENVDIVMRDSVAMLQMVVKSTDHHYIYGGYLGAEGLESILKIMDVIGAKAFSDIICKRALIARWRNYVDRWMSCNTMLDLQV